MDCINELIKLGFVFNIIDGKIQYQFKGQSPPPQNVEGFFNTLKKNKKDALEYLIELQIEALFKAFTDRMAALNGWNNKIPIWLKETNPELYKEWQMQEYIVDERWGLNDLEGFAKALKQYEATCMQIFIQSSNLR